MQLQLEAITSRERSVSCSGSLKILKSVDNCQPQETVKTPKAKLLSCFPQFINSKDSPRFLHCYSKCANAVLHIYENSKLFTIHI